MDVREASPDDADDIRAVARRSLAASYAPALDEATIDEAVEQWYSEDSVYGALSDESAVFLLAVEDGAVVGFVTGAVVTRHDPAGEIRWLHVDPDHRGAGVGRDLLARAERALREAGAERFAGLVLAVNDDGAAFYRANGYERTAERTVHVAGEAYTEYEFAKRASDGDPVPETVTVDGTTLYVDREERERGSTGEFYPVYRREGRADRYGWYCRSCGSVDASMDTMGRIQCNSCGNTRKPSRWDAAYL